MKNKKLVFVTGAGRGIGRAIAEKLCELGFEVAGCARSEKELLDLKKATQGKVTIQCLDVRDFEAQKQWMLNELKLREKKAVVPWGLVSAAGIYGPIGEFFKNDWSQWQTALEINLYGTLHSIRAFVDVVSTKGTGGRIALLSGGGATQPLPNFTSYCASKAAVVRVGETLAIELKPQGITVNSIAPGAVNTKLTQELIEAGPEKAGLEMYNKALQQLESGGAGTEKAANLAAYLMSDESAPVTGRLISAVWDEWASLHKNEEFLKSKEAFTLRRVLK